MNPTHNLNNCIISALKDVTQHSEDRICNILIDILPIGKDAIYRRLRNEVAFSFEEIVRITHKLNLSIDNIIRSDKMDSAIFNISLNSSLTTVENYCNILNYYTKVFEEMNTDTQAEARLAFNTLPDGFFSYKNLTKFRVFRWMHLSSNYETSRTYEECEYQEDVYELHKVFSKETRSVPKSLLILDRNAFKSFIKEIKYFRRLYLISEDTFINIKADLMQLLEEFEYASCNGFFNDTKSKIDIYISDISIEACYMYFRYFNKESCNIRLYSNNGITSYDSGICKHHKDWIESLKRQSTLISRCSEMQRLDYFSEQKTFLEKI